MQLALRFILFCSALFAGVYEANSQQSFGPKRAWIVGCWNNGAISSEAMRRCTQGLIVTGNDLQLCLSGGQCLDELPVLVPDGVPFCGALNHLPCNYARSCGFVDTIDCPPPIGWPPLPPGALVGFQCGTSSLPPCRLPLPCHVTGGLGCPLTRLSHVPSGFVDLKPTIHVRLPSDKDRNQLNRSSLGIRIAQLPIPDEEELQACRNDRSNFSEHYFLECVVENALPSQYNLYRSCIDDEDNKNDKMRAYLCSASNRDKDYMASYDRYKNVKKCYDRYRNDRTNVALCATGAFAGHNERYYLDCIIKNRASYSAAAICALSKDLTPEQQIAMQCAEKTGGQPKAFLVCVGGQLLAREIDKCFQNGVGADRGCFGENNEIRKYLAEMDQIVKNAFGESSEIYRAHRLWQENVVAPGQGHEFVKAANTVINDVRNGGLGSNNDGVKFINSVADTFKSVSSFPCPF